MSEAKFQPGITCSECGHYAEANYVTDTDFRCKYNGRDVCIGCLVTLKMENGDYNDD